MPPDATGRTAGRLPADHRRRTAAGRAQRRIVIPAGVVDTAKPVLFRSWAGAGGGIHHPSGRHRAPADADGRPAALQHRRRGTGAGLEPHQRLGADGGARTSGTSVTWPVRQVGHPVLVVDPQHRRCNSFSGHTDCDRYCGAVHPVPTVPLSLIVMSPSDMVPALANGSIGGYVVADPFNADGTDQEDRPHPHLPRRRLARPRLLRSGDPRRRHRAAPASRAGRRRRRRRGAAAYQRRPRRCGGRAAGRRYLPQPTPAVAAGADLSETALSVRTSGLAAAALGFRPFPYPSFTHRLAEAMARHRRRRRPPVPGPARSGRRSTPISSTTGSSVSP